VLDEDSINSEFILTAQDKNQYVFDATNLLLTRIDWSNHETWTYTYASGQLSEVDDGYGRKLVFAYVDDPGQYDDGLLWRVGDHDTTDLTSTPSGRYVEFGYTPEKNDGSTITSPKALLASVRDVRGNTWTYDWYGQDSGEDDADQLNFLLEVVSPSVDTTGDGTPDGSITSITQAMGIQDSDPALMETVYDFQPSGLNQTHETTAGKVTEHHFTGSIYAGKIDPAGNSTSEWLGLNYRPETRKDGNSHDLQMEWSEDSKYLLETTNAVGNQTQFSYNTSGASADTLQDSTDAQGRKTAYTYDDLDNPRLPTRWQEFTYDDKGRVLTEITYDPTDGTTILRQTTKTYYTSGSGNGWLHTITQEDIGGSEDVVTTFTYDSSGRVIKTQQSSNFGTCEISFTVFDEAGNVVATICNYDPGMDPDPTTAAEAAALYNPDFPDKNQVTTYEYDTLGRRVAATLNDGADFKQTTLTVYDALNRVIRSIGNYKPVIGVSNPYTADRSAFDGEHGDNNTENLVTDTAYNARGLLRKQIDVLGNVTLLGYDDAGRLVKSVQNASEPDYNNDYTGIDPDPSLADYTPGEVADEDIIATQEYDGAGNRIKTVDTLGRVNYTVYDGLNRVVKTVRAANDDASIALNPGDTGYDPNVDPRWVSYILDAVGELLGSACCDIFPPLSIAMGRGSGGGVLSSPTV